MIFSSNLSVNTRKIIPKYQKKKNIKETVAQLVYFTITLVEGLIFLSDVKITCSQVKPIGNRIMIVVG